MVLYKFFFGGVLRGCLEFVSLARGVDIVCLSFLNACLHLPFTRWCTVVVPPNARRFDGQVCASQLGDLVELVRGELSKLARRTLTAPRQTQRFCERGWEMELKWGIHVGRCVGW